MADATDNPPTPGLRPSDARWWLAQWRRENGIEAKTQEWFDGVFSSGVEKAAKSGKNVALVPLEGSRSFFEAVQDKLVADGWYSVGFEHKSDPTADTINCVVHVEWYQIPLDPK